MDHAHDHLFNICTCGSIHLGEGHVHVYNECACGDRLEDIAPTNSSNVTVETTNSFFGGKTEADTKGKALVSVAITDKQKDTQQQYDDDSKRVGGSLATISTSLDALSADVKELGRCLKKSEVASQLLQRVQVRINKEIKGALDSEEKKLKVKDKRIDALGRKLKKIQKNQKKIIFGYKMYQYLRYIVVVLAIVLVVVSIVYANVSSAPPCTNVNGTVAVAVDECVCGSNNMICARGQFCFSNHDRCDATKQ